jgi:hypothetical protein
MQYHSNKIKDRADETALGVGDLVGIGTGDAIDHAQSTLPGDYFVGRPFRWASFARGREAGTQTVFGVEIRRVDYFTRHHFQHAHIPLWKNGPIHHPRQATTIERGCDRRSDGLWDNKRVDINRHVSQLYRA